MGDSQPPNKSKGWYHPVQAVPTKKNSWASLAHFCGTGTSSQARNNFVNSDLDFCDNLRISKRGKSQEFVHLDIPKSPNPSRFASKHLYIFTNQKNSWIFLRPQHEGSQGHLRIFRCTEEMLQKRITWRLPSRGLTYPTWGKGKSSSKCHFWGIC